MYSLEEQIRQLEQGPQDWYTGSDYRRGQVIEELRRKLAERNRKEELQNGRRIPDNSNS